MNKIAVMLVDISYCRRSDYPKPYASKTFSKELFCILFVRFETFTSVAKKNAVFWDIKTQIVLHRKHITFPL
jgi:hypothetical protein